MDNLKQPRNIIYSVIIAASLIAILILCIDFSKNNKKEDEQQIQEETEQEATQMVEYKESIFTKIKKNLQPKKKQYVSILLYFYKLT